MKSAENAFWDGCHIHVFMGEASGGTCKFQCNSGFHPCGTSCVSNTSTETCGTSCSPCGSPPSGGTMTCDGASCRPDCPATDEYLCGDRCIKLTAPCDGTCREANKRSCGGVCKLNDKNSCGASCEFCTSPIKGSGDATCNGSSCSVDCVSHTPRRCGNNICISAHIRRAAPLMTARRGLRIQPGLVPTTRAVTPANQERSFVRTAPALANAPSTWQPPACPATQAPVTRRCVRCRKGST